MTNVATIPMTVGAAQENPAEVALRNAKRDAEFARRNLVCAYERHPDPNRRRHPLHWTIERDWAAAMKAVAAAVTIPTKVAAYRAIEKRLREIAALDKAALAEAAAAQEREMAAIGAETVRRSPAPPPPPSPAAALVAELRRRGVTLTAAGGKIVATPASALLGADIDALRGHKDEILRLLGREQVEV